MNLMLEDVRDFIATLGIAVDNNVYMGKLDAKADKSIGVYNLKRSEPYTTALGGKENESYGTKRVSLLVHWNKSPRDTEKTAVELFDKLTEVREETINGKHIKFIRPLAGEPIEVGTDNNGLYEMVIEAEFIYERKGD